jgi:hypothetical protein
MPGDGLRRGLNTDVVPTLGRHASARSVLPSTLLERAALTMATADISDPKTSPLSKLRADHRSSTAAEGGVAANIAGASSGGARFAAANPPKRPWHGEIDEEEMWYLSRLSKPRDRKADVDRMRAGRPALLGGGGDATDGVGAGAGAGSSFEFNEKANAPNNDSNNDDNDDSNNNSSNSNNNNKDAASSDARDDGEHNTASSKSSSDKNDATDTNKDTAKNKALSSSTSTDEDNDSGKGQLSSKSGAGRSVLLQTLLSKNATKQAHFETAWAHVDDTEAQSRIVAVAGATSQLEAKLRDQELEICTLERALVSARAECVARNARMREQLDRVASLEMSIKTGWAKALELRKDNNKMELSDFERSFHRALMDKLDTAQRMRDQSVADTLKRVQSSLRKTKRARAQSLRSGIVVRAVAASVVVLLRCALFFLRVMMPLLWVCGWRKPRAATGASDSRVGRARVMLQGRLEAIEAFRSGEGEEMYVASLD